MGTEYSELVDRCIRAGVLQRHEDGKYHFECERFDSRAAVVAALEWFSWQGDSLATELKAALRVKGEDPDCLEDMLRASLEAFDE